MNLNVISYVLDKINLTWLYLIVFNVRSKPRSSRKWLLTNAPTSGRYMGCQGRAPIAPPQVVVFHFHVVFNKNYVSAHSQGLVTSSGKSWIRHCTPLSYLCLKTLQIILSTTRTTHQFGRFDTLTGMEQTIPNGVIFTQTGCSCKKSGATVMKIEKPVFKIIKDNYYQERKSPGLLMTPLFRQVDI